MCVQVHPVLPVVGLGGLEPPTSPLSGVRSNHLSYRPEVLSSEDPALVAGSCGRIRITGGAWWSQSGSNRRPPACKAGALPAELWPQKGRPLDEHAWACLPGTTGCRSLVRTPGQAMPSGSLKEVIQPHLPIRLPCYDFTPVIGHTVASALLAVRLPASGATNSHGVTGGVYKARERIHRSNADLRLLAIPTSRSRVADSDPD